MIRMMMILLGVAFCAIPADAQWAWNQANRDGFGDSNNRACYSMVVYESNLCVGTRNGAIQILVQVAAVP